MNNFIDFMDFKGSTLQICMNSLCILKKIMNPIPISILIFSARVPASITQKVIEKCATFFLIKADWCETAIIIFKFT